MYLVQITISSIDLWTKRSGDHNNIKINYRRFVLWAFLTSRGWYRINTSAYSPRASESIPDMYCGYEHFCHAHRDVMITATFSLIYKRMVNAAMLPVIFGFTYFFAYMLLDMNIHIANHIRVLFCIWEFVKLNPEQLNLAVVLIWYLFPC